MKDYFDKFLNTLTKFANTKVMSALKDGFVLTMPATLIGSLALLIWFFPIAGYDTFMANLFGEAWTVGVAQIAANTMDILALIVAVGIAYSYADNEKLDGISAGIISLISFLIVTPSTVTNEAGEAVGNVIARGWIGGNGIIAAILMGLFTGIVYTFFMKRDIRIKMPEGVPEGVSNAFSALIPAFVIIVSAGALYQLSMGFADQSLTEVIFNIIQVPLQGLSDSFGAGLIIVTLMGILFWAGIHGPNIVMGVMAPILTANSLDNQAIIDAGQSLTIDNGAKIMTPQMIDLFVKFGGTGLTLGLIFASLLFARSKQMKQISRLSLLPGIFNINEPMIFGLPIVYNPIMLVPFILTPIIALIITYGAIAIGFMTPFSGIQVPWTTPPIISGFLAVGWQGAIIQILIIIISVAIYYPFVMKQDKINLEQEKNTNE
ncbi:MAG: PTS sugar transporter subunit IIC [Staphylococcus equorum]|nr:PTS sugar transporter subunit IIC [Staphylococcus equorum]